jgi:Mg2+/Co2+ transporter CorC
MSLHNTALQKLESRIEGLLENLEGHMHHASMHDVALEIIGDLDDAYDELEDITGVSQQSETAHIKGIARCIARMNDD